MKKDRNCAMPYPAYPPYAMPINPNMAPNMNSGMMGYPSMSGGNMGVSAIQEQLNNLQGQINMLDKRVTNIENALMNPKENIVNSNYHIM